MQPNHASDTPLPRAVRRQMQGVHDRLAARSAAPSAPAAPTDPAAAPSTAVNDPSAAPAVAAAPVSPAPPAPSAPSPSTADARENSVDYWRDRFRVMQGLHDKLRRETDETIAGRDQELADLRARVAQLEQGTSGPAASASTPDIKLFFTQQEIDHFGEDQCLAMAKAAVKAASDQAQRMIEAEVKPIKDKTKADEAKRAQEAQDAFWKTLDALLEKIPETGNRTIWEINEEPGWLSWLNEPDANGDKRQKHLSRFQRELNAQGVANLVADYLRTKTAPPPPPVAPGGGTGNGTEQQPLQGQSVNGKGYPSKEEFADYSKRAATIRNPRDPRFVTKEERQEMEARLRLPRPPGR